ASLVYSLATEGYVQDQTMPAESILSVRMGAGSRITYPAAPVKPYTQALSRVDDNALIREAQRGNHAAFEELVRHYDQSVLRLALRLTGSESDRKSTRLN